MNKLKIINDPIYGFVNIPNELLFDIIQHPYFQRLRRISQMGLSYLVYPGAHHTRFHHAIGAMHLMQTAMYVLRSKDVEITSKEEEAALIAILLHDIGHGPFSHALEYGIFKTISHEEISLALMQKLNEEFEGKLSLAIQIFEAKYHKKFLTQLISSQIDVDRLDYLRRDSFYSGVVEGQINSERLIKMMDVRDNEIVIEEKGIYSIEKFIISRRLMYWQVYYHKTSLMLEKVMSKILQRAQYLIKQNKPIDIDKHFHYLLANDFEKLDDKSIDIFTKLDDSDIIFHLKKWINNPDFVLSYLCKMVINREHLNKIHIQKDAFSSKEIQEIQLKTLQQFPISKNDLPYLIYNEQIVNQAYNSENHPIRLLKKSKKIIEFSEASDQLNIQALSHPVTKFYLSYPRIKKL